MRVSVIPALVGSVRKDSTTPGAGVSPLSTGQFHSSSRNIVRGQSGLRVANPRHDPAYNDCSTLSCTAPYSGSIDAPAHVCTTGAADRVAVGAGAVHARVGRPHAAPVRADAVNFETAWREYAHLGALNPHADRYCKAAALRAWEQLASCALLTPLDGR